MATSAEMVLGDLDSFLDRLNEEEEEEEEDYSARFLVGETCHECRVEKNPAMAALLGGHLGCLREILRANEEEKIAEVRSTTAGSGATLAHAAARRGDLEALGMILAKSSSLAVVGDARGATPLHVCAYHGHEEALGSLLEAGGDADQPDTDGATPVHFAAASGHLDSLKILVEKGGGNVNARSSSGETPGVCVCVCVCVLK